MASLNLLIYIIVLPIFTFFDVLYYLPTETDLIMPSLLWGRRAEFKQIVAGHYHKLVWGRKHGLFRRSTWGTTDPGVISILRASSLRKIREPTSALRHAINK